MNITERKEIDKLAEENHNLVFGQSTNYSNLEYFLEAKGVDVRYVDSDDIDGYLRWDDIKCCPVIAISVIDEAPVRRRFTMAHELGHLILDWNWKIGSDESKEEEAKLSAHEFLNIFAYRGKDDYTSEEKEQEIRANEFAAAFLIPESKLAPLVSQTNQNAETLVNNVALTFCTSTATAKNRIINYLKFKDE